MPIKRLQLCHSDRVFYERVLDRQGALPWHRCAPLSSRVTFILECVWQLLWVWQCCAAWPRCPVVLTVWMWLCVCARTNTCLAVALGHRQVQVPPKQTLCATRSAGICVHVCVYVNVYLSPYTGKVCVTNIPILYTLCTHSVLRDCVT